MGYRSNVYIKCKKEKAFEFKQFLENYKTQHGIDLRNEENFYTTDNFLYLILNSWKFYNKCTSVKDIINFVSREDLEEYIGMIAIGEDNLAEQYGNCYEVDLYEIMTVEGMDE